MKKIHPSILFTFSLSGSGAWSLSDCKVSRSCGCKTNTNNYPFTKVLDMWYKICAKFVSCLVSTKHGAVHYGQTSLL